MSTTPSQNAPPISAPPVSQRVAAAWLICFAALAFSGWVGERAEGPLGTQLRYVFQTLAVSVFVVAGIWWLRTRRDGQTLASMGMPGLARSLRTFGLGLSIVALPVAFTAVVTTLMGWSTVTVNLSGPALVTLGTGLVTVFLGESLPEELVFRGYIYHTLNTSMARRTAGAATVVLFVLFPVLLVPFQRYVLQMEISIGGAASITGGYLITLTLFGIFVQYLRILSGSVWMGMGFHLAFVLMNRVVGPRPDAVIHFAEEGQSGPIQMALMGTLLILVATLAAWPRMTGRRLGWGERAAA